MLIPIKEYAKIHGKDLSSVRQKCQRGGFSTAQKIGRDWFIDDAEDYRDRRKNDEQEVLFERELFSDDGKRVVGRYYISIDADREILDPFGRKLDTSLLDDEEDCLLDDDLDAFEDGYNKIIDGYEVMMCYRWTIRRKIVKIEYFDE